MSAANALTTITETLERLLAGDVLARTGLPHDDSDAGRLADAVDRLAEDAQARRRHIEQVTYHARRVNRALHTLSASNRALLRATGESAQLHEVCRLIVEVGGYPFAWVGYAEKSEEKPIRPVAHVGADEEFVAGLNVSWEDGERGRSAAGTAVRTGQPALIRDMAREPNVALWREAALAHGFNSGVCLPLRIEGEVAGVLCIAAVETDAFDDEEIKLLAETADDLAFGIETLRARQRQREAEEAFRRVSRQNELILATAGEGIYGTDTAGVITFVNPAAAALLGYEREELLGRQSHATFHHAKPDGSPYRSEDCPMHTALTTGIAIRGKEEVFWRKDGAPLPVEFSSMPIEEEGKPAGVVVTLMDISERKRYLAQLERRSNYDDLTGLPNRNLFADRLSHAINRCQEGGMLAVLLLNLDRFREINDTLGRNAGDQVLRTVSQRLAVVAQKADTLARLVGDEFAALLEGDGTDLAESIKTCLSQPFPVGEHEFFLSASIGIGNYPKDGESEEILLKNAAAAMYQAKAAGGNVFRYYAAEMNARSLERLVLENALRRALENDELVLYYQPQLSLRSGEITGVEALIRWQHPQRGLVSPVEFIPLAETTGLIVPIGEWVLHNACIQNKLWQDAGLPAVTVAVNLSVHQFAAQDVVALAARALRETGLDPQYLELELTESAVMADAEAFIHATEKLKELSVTLSIDDFGTGFSSLSYLKRFAIDRLKIDMSFVRDITRDPNSAAIALAIVSLSHNLKLSVIAEGVETEAQLNFLRARGCDEMQGYYFSKPLPAAAFEQMLRERRKLDFPPESELPERVLLLVDDEPPILATLKRLLRREGYRILTAGSGQEGLEQLASHSDVGVVVCDGRMPQMSGAEFLGKAREMHPDTVRVVLSGYTELKSVTDAVNKGELFRFLTKPWDDNDLLETLREAFRHYEARRR
ncbi:MAG: EAL domain-containing protein [Sulfuricella sp.]|nr:EAL domain-containing protein [Sulfuricella sp.]